MTEMNEEFNYRIIEKYISEDSLTKYYYAQEREKITNGYIVLYLHISGEILETAIFLSKNGKCVI